MDQPVAALKMSEMTVESIMTSEVRTISPQMSVQEAIAVLVNNKISGAPVVDGANKLVSVISEGDLLKLAAFAGLDAKIYSCADKLVKAEKIVTAKKSDSVMDVYKKFLAHQVHRVVVADGSGRLQGIVSRSNVLRVFAKAGGAS